MNGWSERLKQLVKPTAELCLSVERLLIVYTKKLKIGSGEAFGLELSRSQIRPRTALRKIIEPHRCPSHVYLRLAEPWSSHDRDFPVCGKTHRAR